MYRSVYTLIFIFLLLTSCSARPWEVQKHEKEYTGTFVPHLIQGIDSWVASVLSQAPVPLVGAGAALAYIGYAGAVLLTSEVKPSALSARSADSSTDLLGGMADNLINEALGNTASAVAFRRAGARALHHSALILRRGLSFISKTIGALYSTLSTSQRALGNDCVAVRLCRIGQITGMKWPMIGVLLRSLE